MSAPKLTAVLHFGETATGESRGIAWASSDDKGLVVRLGGTGKYGQAIGALVSGGEPVRITVEPADAPAATPLRPAEEVAREMVSEFNHRGDAKVLGVELDLADWEHEDLRNAVAALVTQARADGAAAALAAPQPRDSASRATTCGTCLTALTEEPHRPGCPEPGYIAERERVAALVRAARRWAAAARKTGRPAEELIAADIDLAEAVEALDAAPATDAAQPRDLAGRIRGLMLRTAADWADECDLVAADAYEEVVLTLRACLRGVAACTPGTVQACVDVLRCEAEASALQSIGPFRRAADELEAILREHEAQR